MVGSREVKPFNDCVSTVDGLSYGLINSAKAMRIPQILRKLLDYSPHFESKRRSGNIIYTVAGPSDKVGGRRGGHPDPEISGGESGGGLRIFFRPFGP